MRIPADENVHMEIVVGLHKQGFDLLTAVEANLAGRKDQEILRYAEEHDLLVLSGD
jgi:predicted nuclease of predicted toxin-antitoxin system